MGNAIDALKHAFVTKQPTQIVEKAWHYAHPGEAKPTKDNKNVPPACPRGNMFCYFLPISNCPKAPKGAKGGILHNNKPYDVHRYLYDYLIRRQTWLRKAVYEFTKKQSITAPCTVVHVRRGDVVLHQSHHRRRYYPISQYVNATTPEEKNIFLLTDDANAITEAKAEYPHLNWMYIDRPRYKADEGGWEKQLPSNNPEFEVTTLLSIFRLVTRCNKLIHTRSAFANMLYAEMLMAGSLGDRVEVDKGIKKYHANNTESVAISKKYAELAEKAGESDGKETKQENNDSDEREKNDWWEPGKEESQP